MIVKFMRLYTLAGPGLGVRVLGDVTADNALEILRNVSNNPDPCFTHVPV